MLTYVRSLIHRVAHLLHVNEGRIEDWADGDRWMMGFRCSGCGKLFHVFETDKGDGIPPLYGRTYDRPPARTKE